MKQEAIKERMELLEIGEKLGWPRLGYGRSTKIPHDKRIPQGRDGWEKFCAHAHVMRIYPALRIGRVLRDNNVEVYHPLSGKELRPFDGVTHVVTVSGEEIVHEVELTGGPDLLDDISIAIPAPRRKRGGHKRPPNPNSKRNRS